MYSLKHSQLITKILIFQIIAHRFVYYSQSTGSPVTDRETFFMRNSTRPKTLKWLLETPERKITTIDLQNEEGATALHKAAARSPECAALLVDAKACINIRTHKGALYGGLGTPFHYAMKSTRLTTKNMHKVVCLLLEAGAHVNQSMMDGNTPLHLSVMGNHEDTVGELLKREPALNTKNKNECTPLILAAKESRVKLVKMLLEAEADVNVRDVQMRGALYWAVRGVDAREPGELDHLATVKALVLGKADIDMLDIHGDTALHWAALSHYRPGSKDSGGTSVAAVVNLVASPIVPRSYPKVAKLLLMYKATVDVQNRRGNTALHRATAGYDISLVRLLVESRADPESVNAKSVQVSWQLDAARPQKPLAVAKANPPWDVKQLPHVIQWNLARRKAQTMSNDEIVAYLSGLRGVASPRTHQVCLIATPGLHSDKMLAVASTLKSSRLMDTVTEQASRLAQFKKRIERAACCNLPLRVVKIRDAGSVITLAGTDRSIKALKIYFQVEREIPCDGGLVRVQTQLARRQDMSKQAAAKLDGPNSNFTVNLLRVPTVKGHAKTYVIDVRALLRLNTVKYRTVRLHVHQYEHGGATGRENKISLRFCDVEVDPKGTAACSDFLVTIKNVTKHTRVSLSLMDERGLLLARATMSRENFKYFVRSKTGRLTNRQHVKIFKNDVDSSDTGVLTGEPFGVAVVSIFNPEFSQKYAPNLMEVTKHAVAKIHKLVDGELITAKIAKLVREFLKQPTRILRYLIRRMVAGEYPHNEIKHFRQAIMTRADLHLILLRLALFDLQVHYHRPKGKSRSPLFFYKFFSKTLVFHANAASDLLGNLKYDIQGYLHTASEQRELEIMELRATRQACHISLYFQHFAGLCSKFRFDVIVKTALAYIR